MAVAATLKKHLVPILLGLALTLAFLGHAGRFYPIPLVSVIDAFIYDARLRLTMPGGVDERVVILDIDEKSLAEGGRWPWGRDKMAALLDRLFDHYRIAVLGFDVVFAEPDDSSGLKSLEAIGRRELKDDPGYQAALKGLRQSLDYDRRFAEAMAKRPVVLGYYFTNLSTAQTAGQLPEPVLPPGSFKGHRLAITTWNGYGANLPAYQQNAASAGHFVPLVDFDGVSRRVPMLVEYQGGYYESLSLAIVRLLLGQPPVAPGFADDGAGRDYAGLEWLELPTPRGTVRIPVDESAATLIPYRGKQGSFRYLPIADALHGRLPVEALQGKIVIVGTSTPGLMDLRATPVASAYPGVEIHANLVAGMLDGRLKQKPAYVLGAEVLMVALCGLVLALLLPLFSPARASLLAFGVLAAAAGLNFALWQSGLLIPLASTLLLILALYALSMSWGYFVESRSKRQLTGLFGQYVPPELVEEMSRDPENYSMEGRNEELTVLFSDVRSFTTISEGLDPKELTQLMNEYLGAMTTVIRHNRGTLDKYIGDAIMAFWGAPVADPEHARHAVLTALAMQRELRKLDAPFKARGWPELHIGVGINTGTMTVGDMGSPVRQSYTVMGDAVNLGSRLEGLTKQYGVGILVGETTRAAVKDVVFRELDRVRVKGKDAPVAIYEPLAAVGEVGQDVLDALKLWQQVLRLYRAQDWDQADVQLYNLTRQAPDCKLYRLYAERIAYYRQHPPGEGWDGVTTFETK
ncbi:CHASE2 domain-containing protein [Azospira restricta]|uniref:Adenylate/guanylate cyclase domain-containing protein n=1 Tax=Azospira restricta TaxID=404405 RepID=A0A974SNN5_9RHOO|nr:adenylate/guanylate cyclase domain-containing protein [Azospira restricta]QRJ63622.1 adenylate/guanylate cyclase domain-containing protein [Azospira restricta]